MRTSSLVKLGVVAIGLVIISQLLKQIHPSTLIILAGIFAYSKGWIR